MAPFTPPPGFDPQFDSNYHYIPTKSTAIIFITLFSLAGFLHLVEALYFRIWWLLPTVVLACIGEIIGWAGRYWSSLNDGILNTPFLMQISTTIIAPTPLLAAYFVLLGRLISLLGPQYSRLSAKRYTQLFCAVDVVCLVIQAVGGGIASGNNINTTQLGANIALAGIVIQMVSLIFFMAFGTEFLTRFHYNRPVRSPVDNGQLGSTSSMSSYGFEKRLFNLEIHLKLLLFGMAFSITCIFIRAIYRTVELSDGWDGRIISTQIYFNILDGMMILLATWSLLIFHPGFLLPRNPDSQAESHSDK